MGYINAYVLLLNISIDSSLLELENTLSYRISYLPYLLKLNNEFQVKSICPNKMIYYQWNSQLSHSIFALKGFADIDSFQFFSNRKQSNRDEFNFPSGSIYDICRTKLVKDFLTINEINKIHYHQNSAYFSDDTHIYRVKTDSAHKIYVLNESDLKIVDFLISDNEISMVCKSTINNDYFFLHKNPDFKIFEKIGEFSINPKICGDYRNIHLLTKTQNYEIRTIDKENLSKDFTF